MIDWVPQLSPAVSRILCIGYGFLLFGTLLLSLFPGRWFFLSEKYKGYTESSPFVDSFQSPVVYPFLLCFWFGASLALIFDFHPLFAALINFFFCHYFFIRLRWKSVLRGMGAPGFMAHWLSALVFFLEYLRFYVTPQHLKTLGILAFRFDFAFIILSAGLYKFLAGYKENEGMDFGLVNPSWGHWWKMYRRLPPGHIFFRTLNHFGYATEVLAAISLFIPPFQIIGAFLVFATFLFVLTQIRLGFLCEMVMLACFLYIQQGSAPDRFFSSFVHPPPGALQQQIPFLNAGLEILFFSYLFLLIPSHFGLYYNLLAKKPLPPPFQKMLETYTNWFGMIIWRVFTADLVNFYVEVWIEEKRTGKRSLYSSQGTLDLKSHWRSRFRYCHVGEFVAVTSIFTSLKYYPNQPEIFKKKLLRYAATIPCTDGEQIVFEYVSILKKAGEYRHLTVAEFVADPRAGDLEEKIIVTELAGVLRSPHAASPVHQGKQPGSYAP